MKRIEIGNTGTCVSQLALGGFHQVEISSDVIAQVIDTFVNAGGNYIETARSYGRGASEVKLGRLLKGRRNQVVLASKSSARTADEMRRDVEASLTALQTDHIDFYFFHGVNTMDDLDTISGSGGALEALLEAKEQGVITGMGLSTHRPPELYLEGIRRLPLSLILAWSNYLEEQWIPELHEQVFPAAHAAGVTVTAMKPLADGFLYRSPIQAMRYALGSGADVMVCGMNTIEHVQQAVQALEMGPASAEERAAILKNAPELGNYVCRQCGACSQELMHLFRLEGYLDRQMIDYLPHDPADYALRLRLGGWFDYADEAKSRYAAAGFDADALLKEANAVRCPYGIDVVRKARIASAKLGEGIANQI